MIALIVAGQIHPLFFLMYLVFTAITFVISHHTWNRISVNTCLYGCAISKGNRSEVSNNTQLIGSGKVLKRMT